MPKLRPTIRHMCVANRYGMVRCAIRTAPDGAFFATPDDIPEPIAEAARKAASGGIWP